MTDHKTDKNNNLTEKAPNSRREFLKLGITSSTAIATSTVLGTAIGSVHADEFSTTSSATTTKSASNAARASAAARIKIRQARDELENSLGLAEQQTNNDEQLYSSENYYASFTKTLPSNEFGEVDPEAFKLFLRAMRTGNNADFEAIPLDSSAARPLANPQGAFKFEMSGLDSHATRIQPSFNFNSPEMAGEIGEVYWQAITRDIPFTEYDTNELVATAIDDLNSFEVPPQNRVLTAHNLFRGATPGDTTGPYVSQFLWKDFSFGSVDVVQRYSQGLAGIDFMSDYDNWLNIQKGGAPAESILFDPVKRYITSSRGLSEYVHRDVSYQAYMHAALILFGFGPSALDNGNPYKNKINNQGAFTSFGVPFILDVVTKAANLSLTGAWFQKWRMHRLLRPEAYAGRVNFTVNNNKIYDVPADVLNSEAINYLLSNNGNVFLPMAYTEGSPTHPSYPAGHATIAGACVTVLKAFFDEDFVIPNPVVADPSGESLLAYNDAELTVGNELNKLANNISLGRDAAGVHYRQDGIQGIAAGEQQAIKLLQDQTKTFNETGFEGFTLTKFDGTTITIFDGEVF